MKYRELIDRPEPTNYIINIVVFVVDLNIVHLYIPAADISKKICLSRVST